MKKQFALLAAIAFASVTLSYAQDTPPSPGSPDQNSQPSSEQSDSVILEPSGSDPANPTPGVPDPTAPQVTDPAGASTEPQTTVTVSQTFTNQTNSITIIGEVERPEDKQTVEQAVQQALPGKQINNQLKVSQQAQTGITEPAGAERPSDQEGQEQLDPNQASDQNSGVEQSQPQSDSSRDFEVEIQGQDDDQAQP